VWGLRFSALSPSRHQRSLSNRRPSAGISCVMHPRWASRSKRRRRLGVVRHPASSGHQIYSCRRIDDPVFHSLTTAVFPPDGVPHDAESSFVCRAGRGEGWKVATSRGSTDIPLPAGCATFVPTQRAHVHPEVTWAR
jgi:hypothetical protein